MGERTNNRMGSIQRQNHQERKAKHPWWDDTCENELEKRKKAFEKYNTNRTEETQEKYMEVRRRTNKVIRQTKRRHINEQLKSIEENFRNYNSHDFYRTFANQIKGYTPQNLCFTKKTGDLALNNKENCQELAKYFNKLLNCPEPKERFPRKPPTKKTLEETAPNKQEIETHIRRLKNNRTSGEDGIVAELLKAMGTKTLEELTHIIQEIWNKEKIPEEWKTALIHPLHKKGSRTDVNNYRGISLLPVTYKVLSACLLRRTQEQIEGKISEYQAGFRPNRSCAEQIHNLKNILRLRALRSKATVCTFVDFKKAYDSIDRQSLHTTLEEYGLDGKTRRLIRETLTETKSKVKFMGEISEPFEIKTGVRQGDGLSPMLFNIILDKVMREWEEELKQRGKWNPIHVGRRKNELYIPYLAFADDLAIMTETMEEAAERLEVLKEMAEKVGLQISFEKTMYMATKTEGSRLKTKYEDVYRVTSFKYLGEILEPTGIEKKTMEDKAKKVRKGLGLTHRIYNKRCISREGKIRHYNTVIKPMILYASETMTLNRIEDMKNIKKEERKIIRKILGPRKTEEGYRLQRNETVERHSNIETDIRKRRAKFYGHIARLPHTRIARRIHEHMITLKQQTTWYERTRKDLEQMEIQQGDIQDRIVFRRKIHKWNPTPEPEKKSNRPEWTEERKREVSQRMKIYWQDKKNTKRS